MEPLVPLPGPPRKRKRRPAPESFELPLSGDQVIQVDGWISDKRYSQNLRLTLPDGSVLRIEGFRRGWYVWPENDPDNLFAGGLEGCVWGVLGLRDQPEWLSELEQKLNARV